MGLFTAIAPTSGERELTLPGDDLLPGDAVVMNRAVTLAATPTAVWPWLQQVGKARAGWYLPCAIERLLPPGHRAARAVDDRWQHLKLGDVIPDYGGGNATFRVARIEPADHLVYWSKRRNVELTWAIVLLDAGPKGTRVLFRLRLRGVKHAWLAHTVGDLFDAMTIAGLAAGLRERLLTTG